MVHCSRGLPAILIGLFVAAGLEAPVSGQEASGVPAWELSSEPSLSLGSVAGANGDAWVSVAGAVKTTSGSVAVLDRGTGEVSLFDSDGHHINTVGGKGEGPGEYRSPESLLRCFGDSLVIWDPPLGRISVLDAEGKYVRQISAGGVQDGWIPSGFTCHSNGSFAFTTRSLSSLISQEGSLRVDTKVEVSTKSGAFSVVGPFSGDEILSMRGNFTPPPFGITTLALLANDRIYVGASDGLEAVAYSLKGERIGAIHLGIQRKPLTGAMIREKSRAMSERSPDPEASFRFWSELEYSEQLPAFDQALLDSNENLWIREYVAPSDNEATWRVYRGSGELLATVRMQAGFKVLQASSNAVLVKHSDELGVEHVSLFSVLRRPRLPEAKDPQVREAIGGA